MTDLSTATVDAIDASPKDWRQAKSWHELTQTQAIAEGWCITEGDQSGRVCIQKDDDQIVFTDDAEAEAFVRQQAYLGNEYHRHVLELVKAANAVELSTDELARLYFSDRGAWADYMTSLPDAATALNVMADVCALMNRKGAERATTAWDRTWDGTHRSALDAATYFVSR